MLANYVTSIVSLYGGLRQEIYRVSYRIRPSHTTNDKKRQDDVANIHMDANISQSWRYLDDTCFDFIVF